MMCSGFSVRVYMPGRCLTGSRPFNTLIDASLYAAFGFFVDMIDSVRRFIVVHSSCGQVRGQCVDFSKKAKRNNGVTWVPVLRARCFVLPLPLAHPLAGHGREAREG